MLGTVVATEEKNECHPPSFQGIHRLEGERSMQTNKELHDMCHAAGREA